MVSDATPLVSCIMPTSNRRRFVARAIEYFLRQDYPRKELIIVDDGGDAVSDLITPDGDIRYIPLSERATVGAKRNLACEQALGEVIVHWDDDDWHAVRRLGYQVDALLRESADVCGTNILLFFDLMTQSAWKYVYPASERFWLSGSTLCYRRSFWTGNPFASVDVGEDTRFVWAGRSERMVALPDPTFHVGIIHQTNVSPKKTTGTYWYPFPAEEIRRLMGDDWFLYDRCPAVSDQCPGFAGAALPGDDGSTRMLTVAREADLGLPEFFAFNQGQSLQPLPRMRRWELPFVMFQSRLADTMAVLDCTINPVGFQERLARLYPHCLYRHWNPIQHGQFVPPVGVPDEAFDRVICVNSLEHLLRPQREALIGTMARKLKTGGWLTLTSDYYFDSFWEQPAFLQAGVMRADRTEIFNGWNKVTIAEWVDLCLRHDLHPLGEPVEDPREGDPTLFRNEQPFPHACIAGVFCKGPRTDVPVGKKVVLALLTWNTKDVSADSLRAYVLEARMLQRLGHAPLLCVCDNGSTDGTAEMLRALEPEIELPHRFVYNPRNVGNSIARNQIVDVLREWGGDYVLFMDGDIEVVPFSTFAMLRYLETCGHRLGCIGADSAGQTPFRERASAYHYSIDGRLVETTGLVAWTQYGMFRRPVFEDGVRFDETAPFDQVGWGFEDNDLAFQMVMKGYLNQRFFGMTYLHRNARSSIRLMRQQGIDPVALYLRRKHYVIDKWSSVPMINDGPLGYVRQVNIPIE